MAVYPAEMAVKPPFTNFANNHARDQIFFDEMTLYLVCISLNTLVYCNGGISRRNGGKTAV